MKKHGLTSLIISYHASNSWGESTLMFNVYKILSTAQTTISSSIIFAIQIN